MPHSITAAVSGVSTILVVEDDLVTRHYLVQTLKGQGHHVLEASDGAECLAQASTLNPALILLDLGLPDMEGVEVIKRIREWSRVPIVILSLRGQQEDKVIALDAGADDYLTKPFGVPELMARIRVALRRSAIMADATPTVLTLGTLRIDFPRRRVSVQEREIHLTPIEYNLLAVLARYAGQVVTHTQLLQEVWGPQYSKETNYLRLYVKQLRDKIETDPSNPAYLLTEPGVGYRLSDEV